MPNIIFLFGNDEFAITRKLSEFGSIFTNSSSADMNTARLDARTMSEDELNNAVNSMPFLAKQRLVLLANPSARYNKAEARKKFLEFIEKIPDSTRLVIYESIEPREAEKHWLNKWAEKSKLAQTQAFVSPRVREMSGWILNETKNQNGQMEKAAAEKLVEMVGADTRQAAQEISKLLAYVNWVRPIKVADVEAVSILTAEPKSLPWLMRSHPAMANRRKNYCIVCWSPTTHSACGAWWYGNSVCCCRRVKYWTRTAA